MMVKSKLIIFTLLVTSWILGCSETSSGPSTSSVIMPLAVGKEWVTKTTYYDSTGKSFDSRIDTLTMVSTKIIDSTTYYLNQFGQGYTNKSDGLWLAYWVSDRFPFVPYPVSIGLPMVRDTISLQGPNISDFIYAILTVESTNSPVTVAAGKFSCYKNHFRYYLLSDNSLYFEEFHYYSPNVGMIKKEQYVMDGTLAFFRIMSEELTSMVLK